MHKATIKTVNKISSQNHNVLKPTTMQWRTTTYAMGLSSFIKENTNACSHIRNIKEMCKYSNTNFFILVSSLDNISMAIANYRE